MAFQAQPAFAGEMYDAALRFAADVSARQHDALGAVQDAARTAGELGWPALLVPEALGGLEAGLPDLAAVAEGCGRAGLFLPLAMLCHAVPLALRRCGSAAALALLARVADGSATVALAAGDLRATLAEDGGWRLDGTLPGIAAVRATHYLIDGGQADQPLWIVPAHAAGLQAGAAYPGMDGAPRLRLRLDGMAVPAAHALQPGPGWHEEVLQAGVLVTSALCVGAMGRLVELTIEYLSTRKQFGVELASFQVLRHQVADMYVGYENFRALAQSAIDAAEGERLPAPRLVSLLKLQLGRTGRRMGETAIQAHGGMGMTEELPAARLARRLVAAEFEYGGSAEHLERAQGTVFAHEVAA
ncbi:hypothetical protein GT347_22635 [Xylophilus rhododendri]|uniref:Acyl-CoA dehydrogenase n=1 Tax=Xylophilus rhododendri TaxID=2697032 RepID=A0A857J965_9BURK|nr:acyl-CoA dehydrogenase family protein [Xylophilus rhododendri]QHJ00525.1 hypothetical protein GT347_22635 [Xylophilus rhododendri]